MKLKLLALGSLSLLALLSSDVPAFARWWHCHKCTTQITCRPYNAFTPICWGNLICDGCCPSPCGMASGCAGMPPWTNTMGCGVAGMAPGYGGGSRATDLPVPYPAPGYTPPVPRPMPPGPAAMMMYPPSGVSQANYYPMYTPYMPNYVPTYYNPYQGYQPAPYYWYNGY